MTAVYVEKRYDIHNIDNDEKLCCEEAWKGHRKPYIKDDVIEGNTFEMRYRFPKNL